MCGQGPAPFQYVRVYVCVIVINHSATKRGEQTIDTHNNVNESSEN